MCKKSEKLKICPFCGERCQAEYLYSDGCIYCRKKDVKYCTEDCHVTYKAYSIVIIKQLNAIKDHMKVIHADDKLINYGHIGDIARISCDLAEIQNYL